ncbi:MFS transporter [Micromonospora sp. NPDC000663]|uniref:MFS transporter n=1 Tax=Micromonospora sp. NPDC000663 TaxID=3364218 RepID=UPI0036A38E79
MTFDLLRRNAAFRWFWSARAVSLLGDGAAMVALLLLATDVGGPGAVALVLLAETVPRFFSPLAGALADRLELRRLMLVCELVQGVAFLAIVLLRPGLPVIVALVAASAAASTVIYAAGRPAVPRLVDEADLPVANAWIGTAFNLQGALGALIGGLLAAAVSPYGALGVNAASAFVAVLLLLRTPRLPVQRAAADGAAATGYLADLRGGFRYVATNPTARLICLLVFFGILFGSLDNVALVLLATDVLDGGAAGFGILSGAFGMAMVAGSLWLTRPTSRFSPVVLLLGGWLSTGVGLVLTGFAPWLAAAALAQAVAGVGNAVANTSEYTVLQRAVPTELLGRVGGLLSLASVSGSSLAYAIGAPLATAVSPRWVLFIAGGGLVVVVLIFVVPMLRATRGQDSPPAPNAPTEPTEDDPLPSGVAGGTA